MYFEVIPEEHISACSLLIHNNVLKMMVPGILVSNLSNLGLYPLTCSWVRDFLADWHPTRVRAELPHLLSLLERGQGLHNPGVHHLSSPVLDYKRLSLRRPNSIRAF